MTILLKEIIKELEKIADWLTKGLKYQPSKREETTNYKNLH